MTKTPEQIDAVAKDTKRLDWLEFYFGEDFSRKEIDLAMEESK
jgi:hypothetical protein